MDNNLDQNSIHLIQQLEQRIQHLLTQHKELVEEKKKWQSQMDALENKIDFLTEENKRLSIIEKQNSWNELVDSNNGKEQLKQYLDEVIKQIDANIKMLS